MTTIYDILNELSYSSTDLRAKGDKFEQLTHRFFEVAPKYRDLFDGVWLWHDWPGRGNRTDSGVDIVAQERYSGEYWAVQCKFYGRNHTLDKGDIDSFFTESGKAPFTHRMIVSTTDKWSKKAEEALEGQTVPVERLGLSDLEDSGVDWGNFRIERPDDLILVPKKELRLHQRSALNDVVSGLKEEDRGKLIMACGTGKTFTALRIAEELAGVGKTVVFLAPSISLVSQSLTEWTKEAKVPLRCFAVCSDTKVGKKRQDEDMGVYDLAYPSTTDACKLSKAITVHDAGDHMTVIFSTYQSIGVLHDAQKDFGLDAYDLVICDEAHRTTGVTEKDKDASSFVRVHDEKYLLASKRLYMTATPRIYTESAKVKAQENDVTVWSMDNEKIYGKELHRLGFGEAVNRDLLSDYKVMVLAVDESYVTKTFQRQIADTSNELRLEDAVKIIGCWNGLAKRGPITVLGQSGFGLDSGPMKRAVAFSRSINDSKKITELFSRIVNQYLGTSDETNELLQCETEHVDGTFNVLVRNEKLAWLKEDPKPEEQPVCRILSNARCLSEGVDVPALDAVLFLNPRDSMVDVVQSVGRVMRKAPGKMYGYIILPIGIPAGMEPEQALRDNKRYKVVWDVLQALRAHDDRFEAHINKLDLNRDKSDRIQIIGVGGNGDTFDESSKSTQLLMQLPEIEEWRNAIYAKIVDKCGERKYWENWAGDVAQIAKRQIERITTLLASADSDHRQLFEDFLDGLRENINPSITEASAIEMLSQHLITKPVFDALFENYSFTEHNPVSVSMDTVIELLQDQELESDVKPLEKFYESVRLRAEGVDNAAGKQRIVTELYDKFFKSAFPKTSAALGIVYTPIEVVDFIIHSANAALKAEFGVSLSDQGVHILDPFTGTGTFIVRLLQSGLIRPEDLESKYKSELHANEIVLLAYYIAAINIEETFHGLKRGGYQPFEGIVLTDTFQMGEGDGKLDAIFPENNQRVRRQRATDIRVIIGNPPYSVGQKDANDNNQNLKYDNLDASVRHSYTDLSTAVNKNSLYDSYIRAFRWASDRLKDQGIICFVSNGSFVDSNAMDGLRKTWAEEFSSIYVFNLRGNARTSGVQRQKERGNIFGEGSRTPIAITLLVKNPERSGPCQIFYRDIGDYLTREQKLELVAQAGSIDGVPWEMITPNSSGDWINHRSNEFESFIPLNDDPKAIFAMRSNGVQTNRDDWVYNYNKAQLEANISRMIDFYNSQLEAHWTEIYAADKNAEKKAKELIDTDPRKIKWTRGLIKELCRNKSSSVNPKNLGIGIYRPFNKSWIYYDRMMNEYFKEKLYPTVHHENLAISVTGLGINKDLSCVLVDSLPDVQLLANGQCFPLYYYEKARAQSIDDIDLFDETTDSNVVNDSYVRKEAITDTALRDFRSYYYDATITKEDIFYYCYGILHAPEYRRRFASDLKKMLPRLPLVEDFWGFSHGGRELAFWHLNYEIVEPYPLVDPSESERNLNLRVEKMRFARGGDGNSDKSIVVYNSDITISEIPIEAYDYQVNGKSAIEWIMERYQVSVDEKSGIANDPNDYSDNPRYILDLLKRIVRVSVETNHIVRGLPGLAPRSESTGSTAFITTLAEE